MYDHWSRHRCQFTGPRNSESKEKTFYPDTTRVRVTSGLQRDWEFRIPDSPPQGGLRFRSTGRQSEDGIGVVGDDRQEWRTGAEEGSGAEQSSGEEDEGRKRGRRQRTRMEIGAGTGVRETRVGDGEDGRGQGFGTGLVRGRRQGRGR